MVSIFSTKMERKLLTKEKNDLIVCSIEFLQNDDTSQFQTDISDAEALFFKFVWYK